MTDISHPLQWLNAHPELAGLFTFIISAAESVAIIGTIVPGSIMMTAIGALAGAGVIPLWETVFWAILGAIVGDGISYWLGYHFKDRLPFIWPFKKYPGFLKSGEKFFHQYGGMSVFIGRFVGPVRALVPLVAGMLGMKPWRFLFANITSAIGWAPAYMLPGILLGAASQELPPDIAMHVSLVLLLFILFILLCLWFIYKVLQLIHNQTHHLQNQIWSKLKHSRYLSIATILLKHNDPEKTHGQLTLALYCIALLIIFLGLVVYVKLMGPSNILVNEAVYHLFRGIRSETMDTTAINITLLGQKHIILPIFVVLIGWLFFSKQKRVAVHFLVLFILTVACVFIFKHLIRLPRPWGILQSASTFSMPSGHAAISTIFIMSLAFLVANSLRSTYQWIVYTLGVILIFLVGLSRLYLGAHWFTDVLSSWILCAALLIIVIISYQRERDKPIHPVPILLIIFITFSLTFATFHYWQFNQIKLAYSQLPWPRSEISLDKWWETDNEIPAYHASLFGFPSQQINIQWVGDIQEIKQTLLEQGWSIPPTRNFISTLHRIGDISSTEYLPMISPQYLDKKPELILTRRSGKKGLFVIQLWDAHRTIKNTQIPLWVGVVGIVPRTYSWIYQKRPGDLEINSAIVFPNQMLKNPWHWKTMMVKQPFRKKRMIYQKTLMVKP